MRRIFALCSLSLIVLPGCSSYCDDIGCATYQDITRIAFPDPGRGWTEGLYVFDIVADGQSTRCTAAVPLDADRSCDRAGVHLQSMGVGMGDDAYDYIAGVRIKGLKEEVSLKLSRDGSELHSETFSAFADSGGGDPLDRASSDPCYTDCGAVREVRVDWVP